MSVSFVGSRWVGTAVVSDRWLNASVSLSTVSVWGSSLLLTPFSSASSVISTSLRRRRELDDEVMDPEAVCREQAEESALSVSSVETEREKTVSWGENLSRNDWNCTVIRAM